MTRTKKIGQLLLGAELITKGQLEKAISAQVVYGGKLGSNLIELGFLDVYTLGNVLSKKFRVPSIEDKKSFKLCSEGTIRLLDKEIAVKYGCVPISLDGANLNLLMEDPSNLKSIDEIGFATGKKIIPHVAPEILINFFVEKYYNLRRDTKYVSFLTREGLFNERDQQTEEPPASIWEEKEQAEDFCPENVYEQIIDQQIYKNGEEIIKPVNASPSSSNNKIILTEKEEPPETINKEEKSGIPQIQLWNKSRKKLENIATQSQKKEEQPPKNFKLLPGLPEPCTLKDALHLLKHIHDRDELSSLLLSFAASHFKRSALFITRWETAMGWNGMGGSLDKNLVENIMLPLHMPSIFKTVYESQSFFLGNVPDIPLNNRILKIMGEEKPKSVFLMPILLKKQVVNILYGDNGDGNKSAGDISDLLIFAQKVPEVFEKLIRNKKREYRITSAK